MLLRQMENMRHNLAELLGEVTQNSRSLASSMSALRTAVNNSLESASEQASSASAIAATIEELSVSISQVSDRTANVRELSDTAAKSASEGCTTMEKSTGEIVRIEQSSQATAQAIHGTIVDSRLGCVVFMASLRIIFPTIFRFPDPALKPTGTFSVSYTRV